MEITQKKRIWRILLALVLGALLVYFVSGVIRSLYLESSHIQLALRSPDGTTGTVRMVQVSDLHLAVYGENNQDLVDLIASKKPDVILSTGDMIDARAKTRADTIDLFKRLTAIAPVVFSLGNHEADRLDLFELLDDLVEIGVHVVHDSHTTLRLNGIDLRIGGLYMAEYLYELDDDGRIDVLLCHFPHKLDVFAAYGVPLTFCGHTHGGQFRIPFFDIALYAPNQGLFPQYTEGLYEKNGSYMVVSRGLGNSSFPFRVHNPPEIVVVDVTYTGQIMMAKDQGGN